jgi:hypothetical protein
MSRAPMHRRSVSFWNLVDRQTALLDPAAANALSATDVPEPIVRWLAQAMLLYGVPFEYLVPHPAMLPQESFRFFYIDRNWLYRLAEGAASAGIGSSRDALTILPVLDETAFRAASRAVGIRAALRGKPAPAADEIVPDVWTGFLLRSAVVQGWPGMDVVAVDDAGKTLRLLRIDRLSPTVLLCLFLGVPARIDIMEPPETLHFGVNKRDAGFYANLRGLGFGGKNPGIQFEGTAAIATVAGKYEGVIDAAATAASLKTALVAANAFPATDSLTSAQFAVEMVKAASLQPFKPEAL